MLSLIQRLKKNSCSKRKELESFQFCRYSVTRSDCEPEKCLGTWSTRCPRFQSTSCATTPSSTRAVVPTTTGSASPRKTRTRSRRAPSPSWVGTRTSIRFRAMLSTTPTTSKSFGRVSQYLDIRKPKTSLTTLAGWSLREIRNLYS